MFVVTVMPIQRGVLRGSLSFFSKDSIPEGVVIDVEVRGKKTTALVLETKDAREEKAVLKNEAFALKKVSPRIKKRIFNRGIVRAIHDVARYHVAPAGAAFAHFVPSAVISGEYPVHETAEEEDAHIPPERLVLQAERDERVRSYRNTTREAFARGESVLVLVPTIPEACALAQEISRGIEGQTLLLTSSLTKKAAVSGWNRAREDPEPLLIIATHSFLTVPCKNLKHIFVERESARAYVMRDRPFLDTRIAAEYIAHARGARIIFADFPLRVETHARLREHAVEELTRIQRIVRGGGRVKIVNAKKEENTQKAGVPFTSRRKFSPLTEDVERELAREVTRGGRVFVYASRRGIAPLTVCNDCGTPVTDPRTGAPMTLHKTDAGNVFLSFRSGAMMSANTSCRTCGGWNLVSLGIGVERVYEEIRKKFVQTPLFLLTSESAPTHQKASRLVNDFFKTPGSILVGTDRALPYLKEPVECVVVASLDSALSGSAWRSDAYATQTLFYLQGKASDIMLVQTRLPDASPISAIASLNPSEHIATELSEREQFGFPPFVVFVGLTWSGTEQHVKKIGSQVSSTFAEYELVGPLPPRIIGKNRFMMRAVLRLEKNMWPSHTVETLITSLPPDVSVAIDPDDIV